MAKDKGKLVLKTSIKRQKGKLYYCGTSEDGNVAIFETTMPKHEKKDKSEKKSEKKEE